MMNIVFDLKAAGSADRMFINNQLSIGTTNPINAFQVDSGGQTKVNIDISGQDLMTVNGNLVATNVIVTDQLSFASNLVIDGVASNIVTDKWWYEDL